MIYALLSLTLITLALVVLTEKRDRARQQERDVERESFAAERKAWASERRHLLDRIQIPEAAPFMLESTSSPNDLPVTPDFVVDEDELDRAQRELERVGYEEGPAL